MFLSLHLPFAACAPAAPGLRGGQRGVGDRGQERRPTLPTGCSPDHGTPARHEAGVSARSALGPGGRGECGPVPAARDTDQGRLPAPFAGHKRTEGGHTSSQTRRSGGIQSEGSGGLGERADSGGSPALCPDGSPHPTLSSPLAARPPQCPKEGGSLKTGKTKNRDSAAPNLRSLPLSRYSEGR